MTTFTTLVLVFFVGFTVWELVSPSAATQKRIDKENENRFTHA